MKTLDKLEKYVRIPDTQFYGTYFYGGEDILLHDEVEEYKDDENKKVEIRLTIKDYIKDNRFYKYKLIEDLKNNAKEETTREFDMKKGDMLVFVMNEGFMKTDTPLISVDEAIKRLSILRSEANETNRNEEKNTSTN